MAKIVHRPKPEVVVAPDYNKVLQNLNPARQASMQVRAEHEQARGRFEQSLQKAAGNGESSRLSRGPHAGTAGSRGEAVKGVTNRPTEKQAPAPEMRNIRGAGDHHQQAGGPARPGSQGKPSPNTQQTAKSTQTATSAEAGAREVQIRNTQNTALGKVGSHKAVNADEDDGIADKSLETLACPSPLGMQEPLPVGAEVAPTARAGNTSEFETIESMLNHLSLMTARYGPRDWTFDIQNENSSLASVSLAPAANGGWNVAVTAKPEDQAEAQRYLVELEEMLEDTQLASLHIKDPAQDRTEHDRNQ